MLPDLAQQAIERALKGNWNEAVALNKELLSQNPKDTEALNRLARAYLELGRAADSRTIYKRVLRIDNYNTIAQKSLERLGDVKRVKKQKNGQSLTPTSFIEEPGRTKTITLIHLGDKSVFTSLNSGDPVLLQPHRHRVSVKTQDQRYIGRIPDDLAHRLIKLIQGGNEYTSIVHAGNTNSVRIFIRETKRSEKLKDTSSFPIEKTNYTALLQNRSANP